MLFQHDHSFSPRHSHDLLFGRFINVHGRQGKNIPADLHMKHMNRVLKECIHDLGSNQTEQAITRVGKAMGAILPILDEYDEHNNISIPSGAHKPLNILKDQQKYLWNYPNTKYYRNGSMKIFQSQNCFTWKKKR